MNSATHQILDSALGLPEPDRAALAACLIDSLGETSDAEVRDLWRREIESRLADFDDAAVKKTTWQQLRQRLEARLHEPR